MIPGTESMVLAVLASSLITNMAMCFKHIKKVKSSCCEIDMNNSSLKDSPQSSPLDQIKKLYNTNNAQGSSKL